MTIRIRKLLRRNVTECYYFNLSQIILHESRGKGSNALPDDMCHQEEPMMWTTRSSIKDLRSSM